jgi:hypothetical protein
LIIKKAILALSMVWTIGLSAALTHEETKVDLRVLSAFQKEFSFAKNVKWELTGELAQVRFSLNDQGFAAWYSADAELIGTARNILFMQLPLSVIKQLEEKYSHAELMSILEVTRENETTYSIQVEEKGKKLLLQATPSGNITVVKKIKK